MRETESIFKKKPKKKPWKDHDWSEQQENNSKGL